MPLLELTGLVLKRALPLAAAFAAIGFLNQIYRRAKPRKVGFQTIYPVPRLHKVISWVSGSALIAGSGFAVLHGSTWAAILAALGIAFLLYIPGDVVVESRGVRRSRFGILPWFETLLKWEEIDSAYEGLEPARQGDPDRIVVVSAGLDRTIKLTTYHVGIQEFLDDLESRGVPVGRLTIR